MSLTNQLDDIIVVKNKKISGVSTAVICSLLILWLFLMHFSVDAPEIPDAGGVAVSLGEPDAGGDAEVPVEAYQPPTEPTFEPREEVIEETPDPEAVSVPKSPEVVKKNPTPVPEKPKEPEEDDFLKKMREKNQKSNPANAGTGQKDGTQGMKNGVPGGSPTGQGSGTTGTGPGPGDGSGIKDGVSKVDGQFNHTFGTRKLTPGTNNSNCPEGGTVKVDVLVKADGTIIFQGINPSTKTTSTCLHNLAKKLVSSSRFAPSADGNSAEGTITIKFTLN